MNLNNVILFCDLFENIFKILSSKEGIFSTQFRRDGSAEKKIILNTQKCSHVALCFIVIFTTLNTPTSYIASYTHTIMQTRNYINRFIYKKTNNSEVNI